MAEGQKEAVVLQVKAIIKVVQKATVEGLRILNEVNPSQPVIAIKSLEAFAKAADGKVTKIIIPSEIQGLAGMVTSIAEVFKDRSGEDKV